MSTQSNTIVIITIVIKGVSLSPSPRQGVMKKIKKKKKDRVRYRNDPRELLTPLVTIAKTS